ncbi:hypothetical protein BDV19DRAFT_216913 [Aspergillus venezuelensis]
MRPTTLLQLLLPLLALPSASLSAGTSQQKPPGKNAILLSQVHSLTLRGGKLTSSRRVSPMPQLKCTGPSKRICNMYKFDSMRCTNEGYGYDEEDVQWTCTASLPGEFKLGSTDVVCEGYRNADDPWVLKGSCGVEYRLLLTEEGERKFGKGSFEEDNWWRNQKGTKRNDSKLTLETLFSLVFWGIFLGVFLWIVIALLRDCMDGPGRRARPGPRGGGGGGGGGGPYPGGPPPPYSPYSDTYSSDPTAGQGWRPGFWTGAATGGGLGYGLGRRSARHDSPFGGRRRQHSSDGGSSSSPARFSSPSTSTGFGSTSRR